MMNIALKENDVYSFSYKPEVIQKAQCDLYWCFDGQLVVKNIYGNLYLEDTYWSGHEGRRFTLEKALEKGELKFKCNLDDVKEVSDPHKYYDDSDIINLSTQHHYYKKIVVKKDAKRSKEKMLITLKNAIEENEARIRYFQTDIRQANNKIKELESGNLDIYI